MLLQSGKMALRLGQVSAGGIGENLWELTGLKHLSFTSTAPHSMAGEAQCREKYDSDFWPLEL